MRQIKSIMRINIDRHHIYHQRLIEALTDRHRFVPASLMEIEWHKVINALPTNLQKALLNELENGNSIAAIQMNDWPQAGAIVITLMEKFKGSYLEGNRYGVTYRFMNAPHYWIADIHQIINGVEHLIIH